MCHCVLGQQCETQEKKRHSTTEATELQIAAVDVSIFIFALLSQVASQTHFPFAGMCSTQSTCYKVDVIKNLFLRACVRDQQSATFIRGCSLFVAACFALCPDKPYGIAGERVEKKTHPKSKPANFLNVALGSPSVKNISKAIHKRPQEKQEREKSRCHDRYLTAEC